MDEGLSAAVRKVFVALHREGLIYRDKRLVNWDPKLHTAVSDLEVESRETKGSLWYFKYPIEGRAGAFIVVATTRPETMLGDTGVAVHPDDERYRDLVGQHAVLPLVGRRIPIVADHYADPDDRERRGEDHAGARLQRFRGRPAAQSAAGQHLRPRRAAQRRGAGALSRPRPLRGAQAHRRRSRSAGPGRQDRGPHADGAVWRPLRRGASSRGSPTSGIATPRRWRSAAIEAVESGRTAFVPRQWENTFFEWMRNIQPWCISRQIWWGHQIPAWYAPDGRVFVEETRGRGATRRRKRHYGHEVALDARRRRARHLVLVGAVAVLDPGLARARHASSRAITRPTCWSPASTSSSSGSRG